MPQRQVKIVGAGVAGLTSAVEFVKAGFSVHVLDKAAAIGADACSWYAGGMLAPWCERESAEEAVIIHGKRAIEWWSQFPGLVTHAGSLVVAPARDAVDLKRFASRTSNFAWVSNDEIVDLEPDLGGRFRKALFFKEEAHLDPRDALRTLYAWLVDQGVCFEFGQEADPADLKDDVVVDARGFAAQPAFPHLRGVKGEMLILQTDDIRLSRPVRLVHPRLPLYIVPRENGLFMLGASMIESGERGRITARAMMELLNAAYAIHPAFAEAEIVEIGSDVRPAFPDNLPRVQRDGHVIRVNGLYRHGFLLAPAVAQMALRCAEDEHYVPELSDENLSQRSVA